MRTRGPSRAVGASSEERGFRAFQTEAFDPIRRAPGTFILGLVAICIVVWLLFVLLNERHFTLFVGFQIGFQAFGLEALWRLCERRASLREPERA